MKKFSFLKGLLIGGLFSALFWIGIFQVFNNSSDSESTQIETITTDEPVEVKASF